MNPTARSHGEFQAGDLLEAAVRDAFQPVLMYRVDDAMVAIMLDQAQRDKLTEQVRLHAPHSLPPWRAASFEAADATLDAQYFNPTQDWYFVQRVSVPQPAAEVTSALHASSDAVAALHTQPQLNRSADTLDEAVGPGGPEDPLSLRAYLNDLDAVLRERELANQSTRDKESPFQLEPWPTEAQSTAVHAFALARVFRSFRSLICRISSTDDASHSVAPPITPGCHPNIVEPLCFLPSDSDPASVFIIYPHFRFTMESLFKFSRDVLPSESSKQYVAEQLIRSVSFLHAQGLCHGSLASNCISMSESLWIRLLAPSTLISAAPSDSSKQMECKFADWPIKPTWPELLEGWVQGKISNFEYLMHLNKMAGRKIGDPNFHPVLPWVIDFKSPSSWRELSVSKYRLTKGDEQLDLTFTASSATSSMPDPDDRTGHHVSDIMSELTFYNYFARRMPVWVLRKYVRTNFQPSEYPASVERLFSWSPDECIPEFFDANQKIHESIHPEMPDLCLPDWANAEWSQFVQIHRQALESDYVSANVHNWIDITFGFKLSGEAGRAAKNVALMDRSLPRTSGYLQLFSLPHPSRKKLTEPCIESLALAEQVSRFVGHADKWEATCLPSVEPVSDEDKRQYSWLRFCDMVSLGANLYQLLTGQPLLHYRSWSALSIRLAQRARGEGDQSDWDWWNSVVAVDSARISSFRIARLIFQLVFSNQLEMLQRGTCPSLEKILESLQSLSRRGMELVYGFSAEFESLQSLADKASHSLAHIGLLTNKMPLWAINIVVPYFLPFFRDQSTQRTALDLVEPLSIILGRTNSSRLLLDNICGIFESRQTDSALYADLVGLKFVSMLFRQFGFATGLTKIVPPVVIATRNSDGYVASRAADCISGLVNVVGPHIFVKYVLPLVVQQLSKPVQSEIVSSMMMEIANGIGDDYCTIHLFPVLLAQLEKFLFCKLTSPEDVRTICTILQTICRIVELPILVASPLRVVKSLLVDHPLLLALLAYPHIYDGALFPSIVDCVYVVSRCVGTSWSARHIRPIVACILNPETPSTISLNQNITSVQSNLAQSAATGLEALTHWFTFGVPGGRCSSSQRSLVASKFSELMEAPIADEAFSNWASIGSPLPHEAPDSAVENSLLPPKDADSYLNRDYGFSSPSWLVSIPMGSPPLSVVPLATEGQSSASLPRSVADQVNAWLNPKRSATWSFAGSLAASWKEHGGTVRQLAVHDTERLILSASKDGSVKCWDIYSDSSSSRLTYWGHKTSTMGNAPSSVAFVDRGGLVASCDAAIHIWELERATKVMQIDHTSASFQCICPLYDGRVVAAATTQATVSLTDLRAPNAEQCEWLLPNNQSGLPRVVSPVLNDGHIIAVGQSSGYITFIDIRSGLLLYSWHAHDGAVLDLKPWNDGHNSFLVSCSQDRNLALWNIHCQVSQVSPWNSAIPPRSMHSSSVLSSVPTQQGLFKGHRDTMVCFDTYQDCLFSASGHKVSVSPLATPHQQVKLDRKRLLKPSLKPNYITCMSVLPSSQLVLLGTEDGQIRVVH